MKDYVLVLFMLPLSVGNLPWQDLINKYQLNYSPEHGQYQRYIKYIFLCPCLNQDKNIIKEYTECHNLPVDK